MYNQIRWTTSYSQVFTNTIKQKMNRFVSLFNFMPMLMLLLRNASANERAKGIIGAIIDNSSRIGKEQTVAMNLALTDFFSYSNQNFDLQIRNSAQGDPLQAAFAGESQLFIICFSSFCTLSPKYIMTQLSFISMIIVFLWFYIHSLSQLCFATFVFVWTWNCCNNTTI